MAEAKEMSAEKKISINEMEERKENAGLDYNSPKKKS